MSIASYSVDTRPASRVGKFGRSEERDLTTGVFQNLRAAPADLRLGGIFFVVGFALITALALSIIGWMPLHRGAPLIVLPALCIGGILAVRHPEYGRLAGLGLLLGMLAVLIYDCTRVPFIIAGVWGDFIPDIAKWLFNSPDPNWVVGYGWRYLGNGGGMGLAFVVGYGVLRPRVNPWVLGIGYGVGIWSCLLLTLLLAPQEVALFELTPLTLTLSLIGHVVYGGVLALGITAPPLLNALALPGRASVTEPRSA
jgi:hypothetical protein